MENSTHGKGFFCPELSNLLGKHESERTENGQKGITSAARTHGTGSLLTRSDSLARLSATRNNQ